MKNVAKQLLNTNMYPSQEQFRDETEDYIQTNHPEFCRRVKKNWSSYYEKNIYPPVSICKLAKFSY